MKIYLATTGEYSSYQVVGAYSTKEKAEEAALIFNSKNRIEEFEMDSLPEHVKGTLPYRVEMGVDGVLSKVERCDPPYGGFDASLHVYGQNLWTITWAKDENHAVKSVNEMRIQLKAERSFK